MIYKLMNHLADFHSSTIRIVIPVY